VNTNPLRTSFKFVHAADLHLDSPLKNLRLKEAQTADEIARATRSAFVGLIDLCLERQVDFLLLSGDIYDGDWSSMSVGIFFVEQLARLKSAGISVYIIQGNHDAESRISKDFRGLVGDRGHFFDSEKASSVSVPGLNVTIHGQSFAQPAVTDNLAKHYPAPKSGAYNIGMLHTALEGGNRHAPYAPCTVSELVAKGYDYWALGHVHDAAVLHTVPHVVFSGVLQGRSIREQGPKGAYLCTVEDGVLAEHEFVELSTVRWVQVEISVQTDWSLNQTLDALKQVIEHEFQAAQGTPIALRIEFSRNLEVDQEDLEAQVQLVLSEISPTGLWLEAIRFAKQIERASLPDSSAIRELIDDMTHDEEDFIAQALSSMQDKLPALLRTSEELAYVDDRSLEEWKAVGIEYLERRMHDPGNVK